jgi:hypothetical protein
LANTQVCRSPGIVSGSAHGARSWHARPTGGNLG